MRCHGWGSVVTLVVAFGAATSEAGERRTIGMSSGTSVRFLGTEEKRHAVGTHVQWIRPEKRLQLGGTPGFLVYEAHLSYSWGQRKPVDPFQVLWETGAMALMRWEFGPERRIRLFTEAGWGLTYVSQTTKDLDASLNSQISVGVGMLVGSGRDEMQLTLRLGHQSNAGTRGGNKGHNRVMLIVSRRF